MPGGNEKMAVNAKHMAVVTPSCRDRKSNKMNTTFNISNQES